MVASYGWASYLYSLEMITYAVPANMAQMG